MTSEWRATFQSNLELGPSACIASAPCHHRHTSCCSCRFSKARTEKENELARKGRRWLVCAGAAIAAYIFLSGQYIQLGLLSGYEYEEEEDNDE